MTDEVVELRRYRLHPGARETLIELFERELIEPQEAVGLHVLGQFRDLDAPDDFVWLRGFADMAARAHGLSAFYGGPVWERHKDAANATMIDSDDVLLLRPARAGSGLAETHGAGAAEGTVLFVATVFALPRGAEDDFIQFYERDVAAALRAEGASVRGLYRSDHTPNNFPALPVREGENVVVAITSSAANGVGQPHATLAWLLETFPTVRHSVLGDPHIARLAPTERSRMR